MWKTARRQLAGRVLNRPTACGGHHWHVTGRGWSCCHCPARVSARRAAPDTAGPDTAGPLGCARPAEPTGGLRKWLVRIGPPTARPIPDRSSVASPTPPPRELERV
jgi:hypothetical protein